MRSCRSPAGDAACARTSRRAHEHARAGLRDGARRRSDASARARIDVRTRAVEDEDEFAIFRFTLGIPGFDDEDIPRAVGALGALGLCANRFAAGTDGASDALARSEIVGVGLCLACALAPELGRALKGDERGGAAKGRSNADVDGASSVFALSEDASESAKEDCAWASYAILTNTLASGVVFVDGRGNARLARGTVRGRDDGAPDSNKADVLARVGRAWSEVSSTIGTDKIASSAPPSAEEEYHASRWEIDRAGANVWGFLPPTAETVFARRSPENGGVLIAWSDASRGFSKKDRSWLQALARKLDLAFAS
jgi:hypothetical protein